MKLKLLYGCLYVVGFFLSLVVIPILWMLSPFVKIVVTSIPAGRLGHLVLDTESFMRVRQLRQAPARTWYVFIVGRPANYQLLKMWKRHLHILESRILFGIWIHSTWIWRKTPFFHSIAHRPNQYDEYQNAKPTLSFTPNEEAEGRCRLQEMGIDPDKDWYVCIYARDSLYLKTIMPRVDWSYHDYRNADIRTFRKATEYIVSQGGYVIRMGHNVSAPLEFAGDHIIDYARTCRSDFMDIYLPAKCRFFMGSLSGISDVTMLFDTPRLGLNTVPLGAPPWGKNSLFISKKVKNKKSGKYVKFSEVLTRTSDVNDPSLWMNHEFAKLGYEYVDNTEDEILDVTKEILERVSGTFFATEEEQLLQKRYFQSFPPGHWGAHTRTPMGRDFLKKYKQLLS